MKDETPDEQQSLLEVKRKLNQEAIRLVSERCETSQQELSKLYQSPEVDRKRKPL